MSGYPIGTRLARVDPQGDALDVLRVVGSFDLGEQGADLTVTSALAFGPVYAVDPASLGDYRPESDAVAAARDEHNRWTADLAARLDALEVH